MRMSDSPAVSVQTVISANPERIYEVASDLEAMASFGTEFQAGEWVTGRKGEVGSTFRGRQRLGDAEWETTSTVTAADAGRLFAWTVGDVENPTATWTLSLREAPGGTEVDYAFVHGPGPSGLRQRVDERPDSEEKLIEHRLSMLQENMVKTLEGIRRRVSR